MKQIIYRDYTELSVKSAEQIAAVIIDKPDALLCFPAGETPVGTFKHLIEMNRRGEVSFKQCKIVGLDEWTNLGKRSSENCLNYLKKEFFDHIDYTEKNLCFFDGESTDLERECGKTDEFIRKYGPIDMILLGVGMNGHLGLNEPGVSFDLYSHVVNLDGITKTVGQKYFSANTGLSQGITLGMKHVMETKTVILQVSGKRKSPIVKRLLETEVTTDFPASLIKLHPNAFLLVDSEASQQ
jgi:glucosamine-6-phosphate isomerase